MLALALPSALVLGVDGDTVAAGYSDGVVRLWQLSEDTDSERLALNGHKSGVLALRLSRNSSMLVSGGKDTGIVVWDVLAETGICRLRGHTDAVTDLCLLEPHNAIASVSKDGTLRL